MSVRINIPSDTEVLIQHEIRKTAFLHAMGGPLDTGGRAAIALRFDHGLANFARYILPLTVARRIKVAQAYNPRNSQLQENRGVSFAEIDDWVKNRHVEIWNHSASHTAVPTSDRLFDEVVNSIPEIESQLPSVKGAIWGFNPPGIPGHDYFGFRKGATAEEWASEAGKLILAHHAVASGHIPGTTQRVLDGNIRNGLAHFTIDSRSVSEVIERIEKTVQKRRGLQIMLHPSRLGREQMLSVEGFESILEHLVRLRDEGRLIITSPYQLTLADATNLS